jgi:ATP-dependent Lhr-like helicase
VSPFEELHPALRYHVVNTLGWTQLRPTQLAAIKLVQSGDTVLLLAPTAGGKTEAAVLPLLSRMATEGWQGLSALYVCPLRALLNNLEPRLQRYASLWAVELPSGMATWAMRRAVGSSATHPTSC